MTLKMRCSVVNRCIGVLVMTLVFGLNCGCKSAISRADQSSIPRNNNASDRAAYWRQRGYIFDPRDTKATSMDFIAAHWTAEQWGEFKAQTEQQLARERQARKEEKSASVIDTPSPVLEVFPAVSLAPDPVPILPIAKPLPSIGP